jgi:hypothetical protein
MEVFLMVCLSKRFGNGSLSEDKLELQERALSRNYKLNGEYTALFKDFFVDLLYCFGRPFHVVCCGFVDSFIVSSIDAHIDRFSRNRLSLLMDRDFVKLFGALLVFIESSDYVTDSFISKWSGLLPVEVDSDTVSSKPVVVVDTGTVSSKPSVVVMPVDSVSGTDLRQLIALHEVSSMSFGEIKKVLKLKVNVNLISKLYNKYRNQKSFKSAFYSI